MYKTLKNNSEKLNQVIFLKERVVYCTGRYDMITKVVLATLYLQPHFLQCLHAGKRSLTGNHGSAQLNTGKKMSPGTWTGKKRKKKKNLHFALIPPMFFIVSRSIQKSGFEVRGFFVAFLGFCLVGFLTLLEEELPWCRYSCFLD